MTWKQFFDSKPFYEFSVCHWTLNGIATLSFCKVSPLKLCINLAFFVCQKHSILSDSVNLEISEYDLIWSDHSYSCKQDGTCVYYSFIIENARHSFFEDVYSFWIENQQRNSKIICLYRPPNQSKAKAYSEPARTSTWSFLRIS